MLHDIVVTIYQAYIPGDLSKFGPERHKTNGGFAGVSLLSIRPEGVTIADKVPDGWQIDHEIGGLGVPPYRKRVRIKLPDGVHYGDYRVGSTTLTGLYADNQAADGMGSSVYVYCKDAPKANEGDYNGAIDAAIASGIMLSIPDKGSARREIQAEVVAVSDLYGDTAPANWTNEAKT